MKKFEKPYMRPLFSLIFQRFKRYAILFAYCFIISIYIFLYYFLFAGDKPDIHNRIDKECFPSIRAESAFRKTIEIGASAIPIHCKTAPLSHPQNLAAQPFSNAENPSWNDRTFAFSAAQHRKKAKSPDPPFVISKNSPIFASQTGD